MEKLPIVVREAKKNSKALQCFGVGPILHGFNLVGIYTNFVMPHNMAQIFHLNHTKRPFVLFHKQEVILKKLQYLSNMLKRSVLRLTIDEDVVK